MQDFVFMVLLLTITICVSNGENILTLIPNGHHIPNPCNARKSNVDGHEMDDNYQGSEGNPFVSDFNTLGMAWSTELCNKDSDNDGVSNGEELGDPGCTWEPGSLPSRSQNISNPGICEPLDATKCSKQNDWLRCDPDNCKAFNSKDVLRTTIRFPEWNVPTKRTSYHCMVFNLPGNDTYHLIGTKPIIDNIDTTHHILLFGCDEREGKVDISTNPFECGMRANKQCVSIIGTWTIGSHGDCFHDSVGFKIGPGGFQRAALQIHWNNPSGISNMTDSSGLELFFTKTQRKYDAGTFAVGQENLIIPPGLTDISFHSTCTSECTEVMFPDSIYITRAVNHMHYAGIQQSISIYRDNEKIRDITNEQMYSYDKPVFYSFDPPIQLKPGDEIKTTCTYSSLTSNKTIYFGEGTSDEMCYGFITYYPVQDLALPYCTTWKTVEKCKRYLPQFGGMVEGCKWRDFLSGRNQYIGLMMIELALHCDVPCSLNCTEKVKDFRKHECLHGDLGDFMVHKLQSKYPPIRLIKDCFAENKGVVFSQNFVCLVLICISLIMCIIYD